MHIAVISALMCMSVITSCEDDQDQNRDGEGFLRMKWVLEETGEQWELGQNFTVQAEGETYTLECANMNFRISQFVFNDQIYFFDDTRHTIIPDFLEISQTSNRKLVLKFYENHTNSERSITLIPGHCNSSSVFEFTQLAN